MVIEELVFAITYFIAGATPLLRFRLGDAPIYVMDIFLVLSLVTLLIKNRRLMLPRLSSLVLLSILLLIVSVGLLYIYTEEFMMFLYANGRRILATLAFFISAGLCLNRPGSREFIQRVMIFVLMVHAGLIVFQYVMSVVDYRLLRDLDDFFYKTLCAMPSSSRTVFWQVEWYVPRAFGGYWNPNSAVPALFIPLAFCFFFPYSRSDLLKIGLVLLAGFLTGSRQAYLATLFLVVVNILYIRNPFNYLNDWFRITILAVALVFLANLIPFRGLDRPDDEAPEGLSPLQASIVARLNNYPGFVTTLLSSEFNLFLFGKGIDYFNIAAHTPKEQVQKMNLGFVSNSWLLPVVQQGILGFLVLLIIYIQLLRQARRNPQYEAALLVFTLIAICDNHLAALNHLQVIYWTIAGVIAASPLSQEAETREYQKPVLWIRKEEPLPSEDLEPVPENQSSTEAPSPARAPYSPPISAPGLAAIGPLLKPRLAANGDARDSTQSHVLLKTKSPDPNSLARLVRNPPTVSRSLGARVHRPVFSPSAVKTLSPAKPRSPYVPPKFSKAGSQLPSPSPSGRTEPRPTPFRPVNSAILLRNPSPPITEVKGQSATTAGWQRANQKK